MMTKTRTTPQGSVPITTGPHLITLIGFDRDASMQ